MARRKNSSRTPAKRAAFLDALAGGSSIADAAKAASIGLRTAYNWRSDDDAFAADWDEAYAQGAEALEGEARRRAVDGVDEPVFHRGQIVGHTRKYSDTLLIMLMKARDPLRFCDKARTAALMRKWAGQDAKKGGNGSTSALASVIDALDQLAAQKAATALPASALN